MQCHFTSKKLILSIFYFYQIIISNDDLQGLVFDLERESTLHIDLAKSNSRSKRPRTGALFHHILFNT